MVQNAAVSRLKNKITTRVEKAQTLEEYVNSKRKMLEELLPSNMSVDRFLRIAYTAIRINPKLTECTQQSIIGALFQAAQLGLEPNVEGQAYIIPYTNTKNKEGRKVYVTEAQFQIGYKGYVELFYRHGAARVIDTHAVYENDIFEYAYGSQPYLKHCPVLKDRGKVIAYYAVALLENGASVFKVMSKDECIEHAKKHSKSYITKEWDEAARTYKPVTPHFEKNSPWARDFNAMCKKTVLIQLAKLLPKSIELQHALATDGTTKSSITKDMFQIPDETNWNDNEGCQNSALLPQAEVEG